MAQNISTSQMSPVEKEFYGLISHADDFFKIELLRQAKSWYLKALEMNIETEMVKKRIAECDRLLAYENKLVTIIVSVAVILALATILLF